MAIRYDKNTKARAVRLVFEHVDDYETQWSAIKAIAGRLGMSAETLRRWVRQAEVDAGAADGAQSLARVVTIRDNSAGA
ncbi:MAG: transposase [Mycobacterium sp.]